MVHVQDLILLGLLKESPKHGYEIKQVVDERLQRIASITSGTVYYTLRKLERQGFVSKKRARTGRRPEKYVYHVTSAGEEEFARLHRESFFAPDTFFSTFNAGLYFIRYADLSEVLNAIDTRLKELDGWLEIIAEIERKNPGKWPFHLRAIRDRAVMTIEMSRRWYSQLREEISKRKKRKRRPRERVAESREN
ncbi:MAG: PadR family transcriptional regulator [Candidatus Hydrogenedentes bacterium]|nr:PadR family transcriptional regulator [Candidatus Hydrogenedentota bacterium]